MQDIPSQQPTVRQVLQPDSARKTRLETGSTPSADAPLARQTPARNAAPPPAAPVRPRRWFLTALVAWLVGLTLGRECPREIARWHMASALEQAARIRMTEASVMGEAASAPEKDAQLARALESINRAIAWDPLNPTFYTHRARFRFRADEIEGSLRDCSLAIQLAPGQPDGYRTRSQFLSHVKRHREAVEDCDEIVRLRELAPGESLFTSFLPPLREAMNRANALNMANALNNAAYIRALGNLELEKGLSDANQAIALIRAQREAAGKWERSLSLATTLDTRGFLHLLLGDLDAALRDLDEAHALVTQVQQNVRWAVLTRKPADLSMRMKLIQVLAAIHYHRGQVYERLGKLRTARADKQRGRKLGFNPETD